MIKTNSKTRWWKLKDDASRNAFVEKAMEVMIMAGCGGDRKRLAKELGASAGKSKVSMEKL